MMDNKVVIDGEAPETDSEDEINCNRADVAGRMTKSVQGAVIAGEASESDDEHGASISSAASALAHAPSRPDNENTQTNNDEEKYNSLLHKKLKERNRSLSTSLQWTVQNAAAEAARSLTGSDQRLLRSQVTLQSGIGALRALGQHAALLRDRVQAVVTSNFFHGVRLP